MKYFTLLFLLIISPLMVSAGDERPSSEETLKSRRALPVIMEKGSISARRPTERFLI
jgi:hypothetical protein